MLVLSDKFDQIIEFWQISFLENQDPAGTDALCKQSISVNLSGWRRVQAEPSLGPDSDRSPPFNDA